MITEFLALKLFSTKSKPNEVASSWEGGARERSDDSFF